MRLHTGLNVTLIIALIPDRLEALLCVYGEVNGDVFVAYFDQVGPLQKSPSDM